MAENELCDDNCQLQESPTKFSGLKTIQLNDAKAGLQGLNKDFINKVIYETSKGTPYFTFQEKRQHRIDLKVKSMLEKLDKVTDMQREAAMKKIDALCSTLELQYNVSRSIVHIDMDAFYAAVEVLDNPDLQSKPFAVGSSEMLSTSSYEARKYGVRAAMPGFIAKKLCPDLIIVPCNFQKYREISKKVQDIVAKYDPDFTSIGLDEVCLDLTDYIMKIYKSHCSCYCSELVPEENETTMSMDLCHCPLLSDSERDMYAFKAVEEIREEIYKHTQLTASAGIAPNARLAKICSNHNKPNGQFQITSSVDEIKSFIANVPIEKVSGIGPVQSQLLNALDIYTCKDIWTKRDSIELLFSPASTCFYLEVTLGIGDTIIKSEHQRKSIGSEETFKTLQAPDELFTKCKQLCSDVVEDLISHNLLGKVVVLKIKTTEFNCRTRHASLPQHTSDKEIITKAATRLLSNEIQTSHPIPLKLRLMGIRMTNLVDKFSCSSDEVVKLTDFLHFKGSTTTSSSAKDSDRNLQHFNNSISNVSVSTGTEYFPACSNATNEPLEEQVNSDNTNTCTKDLDIENVSTFDTNEDTCSNSKGAALQFPCPLCGANYSELQMLNMHIDNCLSKQAIKDLLASDNITNTSKRKTPAKSSKSKKPRNDVSQKKLDYYFH